MINIIVIGIILGVIWVVIQQTRLLDFASEQNKLVQQELKTMRRNKILNTRFLRQKRRLFKKCDEL